VVTRISGPGTFSVATDPILAMPVPPFSTFLNSRVTDENALCETGSGS
jgi:hypothetical protein